MVERNSGPTPQGEISSASRSARGCRSKYRNPLFWVQIILALGIIAGAWLSLSSSVKEPEHAAPSHIGNLKRVSLLTGEDAMRQMRGLHGKDIGVVDGYLATYRDNGEEMTLWVGVAGTEPDAEELLVRMAAAISRGGTPFSPPSRVTMGGQQMFSVLGKNDMNYFFKQAHSVVWVTLVNSAKPVNRLNDILKVVKFD